LYTNIDIPEARKLIEKHSGEENVPKIIDMFRSMQGSIEEQMFHNRYTLHEITELRKDNIYNEVTYLFLFFSFHGIYILHSFGCRISYSHQK
jgi:hypothetical protein